MTEYLRDLLYPTSLSNKSLGELIACLKPYMFTPVVASLLESDCVEIPPKPMTVTYEPPVVVPAAPIVQEQFSTIFWCAYMIANGSTLPLAFRAKEERRIREDCVTRTSIADVKQRFPFLTLAQIQGLLQEIQMHQQTRNHSAESPATWYIWSIYYADSMPTLQIIYDRVYLELVSNNERRSPCKIVYDKKAQIYMIDSELSHSKLYQVTNLLKPINGMGSYKSFDLENFAVRLEINDANGLKKGELYKKIVDKIDDSLKVC